MEKLNLKENQFIFMTIYRDFNVNIPEKLEKILKEVDKISKKVKAVFLFIQEQKRIKEFNFEGLVSNIVIIEPIDYLQLIGLTKNCYKVITDNGGF